MSEFCFTCEEDCGLRIMLQARQELKQIREELVSSGGAATEVMGANAELEDQSAEMPQALAGAAIAFTQVSARNLGGILQGLDEAMPPISDYDDAEVRSHCSKPQAIVHPDNPNKRIVGCGSSIVSEADRNVSRLVLPRES